MGTAEVSLGSDRRCSHRVTYGDIATDWVTDRLSLIYHLLETAQCTVGLTQGHVNIYWASVTWGQRQQARNR